jgi:hypothetical protein
MKYAMTAKKAKETPEYVVAKSFQNIKVDITL